LARKYCSEIPNPVESPVLLEVEWTLKKIFLVKKGLGSNIRAPKAILVSQQFAGRKV
jgi:hypothetical protein